MRFYTLNEVCVMFGVTRTTIERWERDCGFPPRAYLGLVKPTRLRDGRTKKSNCRVGFPDVEVNAWAQQRMDKRTAPSREGTVAPDEE